MRDDVRYRVSLDYKPSRREAASIISERIKEGMVSGNSKDTFHSYALKYIELKENTLSPSTIRSYGSTVKSMPEYFLHMKLQDIAQPDIDKLINDVAKTHKAKTVRNYHGLISAVIKEYRPHMQLHTKLPQKEKYAYITPERSEIDTLFETVKGTRYDIAYRLGCYGLRRSEVCALTATDLNGNTLTINKAYIRNKNNEWIIKPHGKTTESNRSIYIDDYLADLIREKEGRLFEGYPTRLNDHLKELQKRLNMPHFRFHDLRAYYASMAHAMGIPDAYIMANGGWSSPHVMQRVYRRAMDDEKAKMNQIFAKNLFNT